MSALYMGCPEMTGWVGRLWRGCISQSPPQPSHPSTLLHPAMAESPTPTPLHFIHFVRPLRSAGKASKSSLYCTRRTQRLGLLSHFLDVPLDSGAGFVGIDANISIKQLPGTGGQSTRLFLGQSRRLTRPPPKKKKKKVRPRELNTCVAEESRLDKRAGDDPS